MCRSWAGLRLGLGVSEARQTYAPHDISYNNIHVADELPQRELDEKMDPNRRGCGVCVCVCVCVCMCVFACVFGVYKWVAGWMGWVLRVNVTVVVTFKSTYPHRVYVCFPGE